MHPHLRHLITLQNLNAATLVHLLDRAEALRVASAHGTRKLDLLHGRTVLNLFFEASTRTRTSFELAARRLDADVVNFDIANSSTNKGETLLDTLHTLEAMHLDALIVRHRESGTPDFMVRHAASGVSVINAGDGHHAHPTQGLLDALTVRQHRRNFDALTVTICGDVLHSRVARSDVHAFSTLGVRELRLCGPRALLPGAEEFPGCVLGDDFDAMVAGSDVVIMLRLQNERMSGALLPSAQEYFMSYGLTPEKLALAKPDAIVMHPGPVNRGVEIDSRVVDGGQSVVLPQVTFGIAVRMAVMGIVAGNDA